MYASFRRAGVDRVEVYVGGGETIIKRCTWYNDVGSWRNSNRRLIATVDP